MVSPQQTIYFVEFIVLAVLAWPIVRPERKAEMKAIFRRLCGEKRDD
jgi:hypothetical protein